MPITITFANSINTSVQVGDIAYHCTPSASGGFNTSTQGSSTNDNIHKIGPIQSINNSTNTIVFESTSELEVNLGNNPVGEGSFILFSKDNRFNMSSPLGYYAQVKFMNDSKSKGEMFATACEVFISSK
jgi:hypothetical protein